MCGIQKTVKSLTVSNQITCSKGEVIKRDLLSPGNGNRDTGLPVGGAACDEEIDESCCCERDGEKLTK